jgi:CubicO group peptidase (beta-lactamase class C family)
VDAEPGSSNHREELPIHFHLRECLLFAALTSYAVAGHGQAAAQTSSPGARDDEQRGGAVGLVPAERIDAMLAGLDTSDAPGVSVAVFRKGEIVYRKAVGMADLEHGIKLTTGSVFNIASMSKQFTAAVVVLLQMDGRLSLDDDIRKYVPEVQTEGRTVTIRQLLQHTSGIRDYLDLMDLAGLRPQDSVVSQSDVLDVIASQRQLNFPPGQDFRYENTSYAIMATVVLRVSGKSLRELADERIFRPLGMSLTRFRDDHTEIIRDRACGYEPRPGGGWRGVTPMYDEVGDGGVWTTTGDLAKWDASFYNQVVLGRDGIREMTTQAVLTSGETLSYALGLFIGTYHGHSVVSHGGVDPGYRAEMLRFPDEGVTVSVLANNSEYDALGLAHEIADLYLPPTKSPVKKPAPQVPALALGGDMKGFLGRYLDSSIGRVREIVRVGGGIVLRSRGKDYPLTPISTLRFEDPSDGTTVSFDVGAGGVRRMVKSGAGQAPATSRLLPGVPPTPNASEYVGTYASSELKTVWVLRQEGSSLMLTMPHEPRSPLTPLDADEFLASPGLIRFTRAPDHRVSGLAVTNVRDTDIRFSRSSTSR